MEIKLNESDLAPLIARVVRETLANSEAADHRLPSERLGFPEAEAARLLGVPRHRLRDARLRGEISARRLGKAIVYSRETLVKFLAATD